MSAVVGQAGEGARRIQADGFAIGYAAIAVTVIVWAGFALSIRYITASPLAVADVALMRFGVPTLVLLPFLPSRWKALRAIGGTDALMVIGGAGVPFFFAASAGGASTSAAYVGALIAGTAPLSVVLLNRLIEGRFPAGLRWPALATIVAGAMALVAALPGSFSQHSIAMGVGFLLSASVLWGIYTIGLRRTGLDAVSATLLLNGPSLILLGVMMAAGLVPTRLGSFGLREAAPFLLAQGFGAGLVASLTYVIAIRRLGAARSAVIGSLAPAIATLVAIPLLGEPLTVLVACGIVAITAGVMLSSRSKP